MKRYQGDVYNNYIGDFHSFNNYGSSWRTFASEGDRRKNLFSSGSAPDPASAQPARPASPAIPELQEGSASEPVPELEGEIYKRVLLHVEIRIESVKGIRGCKGDCASSFDMVCPEGANAAHIVYILDSVADGAAIAASEGNECFVKLLEKRLVDAGLQVDKSGFLWKKDPAVCSAIVTVRADLSAPSSASCADASVRSMSEEMFMGRCAPGVTRDDIDDPSDLVQIDWEGIFASWNAGQEEGKPAPSAGVQAVPVAPPPKENGGSSTSGENAEAGPAQSGTPQAPADSQAAQEERDQVIDAEAAALVSLSELDALHEIVRSNYDASSPFTESVRHIAELAEESVRRAKAKTGSRGGKGGEVAPATATGTGDTDGVDGIVVSDGDDGAGGHLVPSASVQGGERPVSSRATRYKRLRGNRHFRRG